MNSFKLSCMSSLPARLKNESASVVTILYINLSDAQGQITPELAKRSGGNMNSFKLSCMFSLPARMKMIQSKMNGLEWSQHFSHYASDKI